jgi:hypothetical protein
MDLAGVGERATGSAGVGGFRWGRTPGVVALWQEMRSVEGVRTGEEHGMQELILFFLGE